MSSLSKDLRKLVDKDRVRTEPEDLYSYSSDATHHHVRGLPDAVVLPVSTLEVSKVVKYALDNHIHVTPRGAGSGLSGGCTPVKGGIVMDMKRMNTILGINRGNMTAKAECGTVTGHFHRCVEQERLFYPPDPQSMSVCTLGGNVSTRAGGPRGVKYGTTGNYVLGLEVVLPDGEIIRPGGSSVKNSVGYDITHLLTGAEGTLGIITQVTTRLIPLPECHRTIIITSESTELAARMVSAIIAGGAVPAMLEYITQTAAKLMNQYITPPLATDKEAYLFLDVDGSEAQVAADSKKIRDLCHDMGASDVRVIKDEQEASVYWLARSNLYPLLVSFFKRLVTEDVTVPRDCFPELIKFIGITSREIGIQVGGSGHAGDGNIHPSVMMTEVNEEMNKKAEDAVSRIIKKAIALGGSISGEHGIGLHKSQFLELALGKRQVELLRQIKRAMDPTGIMNPGKIWMDGGAGQ